MRVCTKCGESEPKVTFAVQRDFVCANYHRNRTYERPSLMASKRLTHVTNRVRQPYMRVSV